jgi:hypothetical protein
MANEGMGNTMEQDMLEETGEEEQQQLSQLPPSQPQQQPALTQPPQQTAANKGRSKKQQLPEFPCVSCGKNVTGASVQCTICTMWCHKACTNLSNDVFKGLEAQAREVGVAYWACRSCLTFATKVNKQLEMAEKRPNEVEARVEQVAAKTDSNEQRIDKLTEELSRLRLTLEAEREDKNNRLCDELCESELRKNNLVIHGVLEANEMAHNRDRLERDKLVCGEMFKLMNIRLRPEDLRFCRRIGQQGQDPRPIIIGLRSEEEKKQILDKASYLRGTQFDTVAIGPDQTKMQRRGEERLQLEAEARNRQLSIEDAKKNLRWLVVGRKGEKRLIKGTEREYTQPSRRPAQLSDYVQRNNNNTIQEPDTCARLRDTNPLARALLQPVPPRGRDYTPVQHREPQQQYRPPQQYQQYQPQQPYSQRPTHNQQSTFTQQQSYSMHQAAPRQHYTQPQRPHIQQPNLTQRPFVQQPMPRQQPQFGSQSMQQQTQRPQQPYQQQRYASSGSNQQHYDQQQRYQSINNGPQQHYPGQQQTNGNGNWANDSVYLDNSNNGNWQNDGISYAQENPQSWEQDQPVYRSEEPQKDTISSQLRPRLGSKRGREGSGTEADSMEMGPPRTRSNQ